MPRNLAGVYTLPNPPVVTDTTILSLDENVTRDDLAAEITNSLDRQGRGGMLAPFRIADGVLAAPGLAFLNDPDNGLYRIGPDSWALAAGGTQILTLSTLGASLAGSLAVSGDVNVGGNITAGGSLNITGPIGLNGPVTINGVATLNNTLVLNGQNIIESATNGVAEIGINFVGFNAGVTQFRNFTVYDGKQAALFHVNGTNQTVSTTGSLVVGGSIITTGSASPLQLGTGAGIGLVVQNVPFMVNAISIFGSAAGQQLAQIFADGADPNVSLVLSSRGIGSIAFYSHSGGALQAAIGAVPGATKWVHLQGAAGAEFPLIQANAGPLRIASKTVFGASPELSPQYLVEMATIGGGNYALLAKNDDQFGHAIHVWNAHTVGDGGFINFYVNAGATGVGGISYNRAGGLVSYNTTSDYRAKEIKGEFVGAAVLLKNLKVYLGKMKGATMERPMLIAHEAQSLTPWLVSGEKDAVDAKGKPVLQQMNEGGFTPLLIAGWQALEQRISKLEGKVLQ